MLSTAERPERSSVFVISRHDRRRGGSRAPPAAPGRARLRRSQCSCSVSSCVDARVVAGRGDRAATSPGRRRRRRRLLDDRRPLDALPGSERLAEVDRHVAPAAVPELRLRASPAAAAASRRRGPTRRELGVRAARGRPPFQYRHSIRWPGSLTANTRSCTSWKASSSARDVRLALEPAARRAAPRAPRPGTGSAPRRRTPCRRASAASLQPVEELVHLRARAPPAPSFTAAESKRSVSARRLTLNSATTSESRPPARRAARRRCAARAHARSRAPRRCGAIVEPARAAAGDEQRLARVDALVDRDVPDRRRPCARSRPPGSPTPPSMRRRRAGRRSGSRIASRALARSSLIRPPRK